MGSLWSVWLMQLRKVDPVKIRITTVGLLILIAGISVPTPSYAWSIWDYLPGGQERRDRKAHEAQKAAERNPTNPRDPNIRPNGQTQSNPDLKTTELLVEYEKELATYPLLGRLPLEDRSADVDKLEAAMRQPGVTVLVGTQGSGRM